MTWSTVVRELRVVGGGHRAHHLRLHAGVRDSADLLADRAGVVAAVEGALRVALGWTMFDARTLSAGLRREPSDADGDVSIRVLDPAD